MNFQTSVRTCLKEKYCTFQGRASRSELWFFELFTLLYAIVVGVLIVLMSLLFPNLVLLAIVFVLACIAILIPIIAVNARRLHDVNLSGWWQLSALIPIIFLLIMDFTFSGFISDSPSGYFIFEGFIYAFSSFIGTILLIFYVRRGNEGENRFGSSPLFGIWQGPEMDFQTSIQTCLKEKYCTCKGRASRSEFWLFMLFLSILDSALILFASLFGSSLFEETILTLALLATFIPTIAVTARRLHDGDNSGWWQLIVFIPAIFASPFYPITTGSVLLLIGGIVLFVFLIQKGTEGENRFAPPFWERGTKEE